MDFSKKSKFIKIMAVIYLLAGCISLIVSVFELLSTGENVLVSLISLIVSVVLIAGNFIVYNTVGHLAEVIEPIDARLYEISRGRSKLLGAKSKETKPEPKTVQQIYNPTIKATGERWTCSCGESNHPNAKMCINCGKVRE